MRRSVEDWAEAEHYAMSYPRAQIQQFSPRSNVILEIRAERDIAVMEKLYARSLLLGDDRDAGWRIRCGREFHMTDDSALFPPRPSWEARGYQANEYGLWVGPEGDVALPLYEGRMIGQFDFSAKGWVRGKGRGAEWREIPFDGKTLEPQYLMARGDWDVEKDRNGNPRSARGLKIGFMDITSATNERTTIAAALVGAPCGHSVTVMHANGRDVHALTAILNSLTYDFAVRSRCGGLHLSYFVIEETPLPKPDVHVHAVSALGKCALSLGGVSTLFAGEWLQVQDRRSPWKRKWAVTEHERLRLRCAIDALVAELYGLDVEDMAWMLRDCDLPSGSLNDYDEYRRLDPKGFWRVDKEKAPELRHTVLSLVAFQEFKRLGLDAFLALNDGEGWMLPEKLRLADYGLGHDDRAREAQPVASRLGPRFLPWQLEQGVEESWEECARHAEKLKALLGSPATPPRSEGAHPARGDPPTDLFGEPLETDLFGNVVTPGRNGKKGR